MKYLTILMLLICASGFAQKVQISKVTKNDEMQKISTPLLDYWLSNNGRGATDPNAGTDLGFYFPKNTSKSAIYADGLLFGGKIQITDGSEEIRVGGGTYFGALQAGKILEAGKVVNGQYISPIAEDPNLTKNRIYKIIKPETLPKYPQLEEYSNYLQTTYNERMQSSKRDFEEWPISDGADSDQNGDPLFYGNEVLFYVSNDNSLSRTSRLYGSKPMGIEIQHTAWTYYTLTRESMIVFVKRRIINKSGLMIKDFYFSQWSDPDLGGAGNDLVGVDTLLDLAYVYNNTNRDDTYNLGTVPAVGYVLLQGPVEKGNSNDTANYYGQKKFGYKNRKSSSFFPLMKGTIDLGDAVLGDYFRGTLFYYRYMQGLDAFGIPYLDLDNKATKYPYSGDPVSKTGQLDGIRYAPADRRIMLNSGPYQFAAGDTLDFVFAVVIGQGEDHLNSITELRRNAEMAKTVMENLNLFIGTMKKPTVKVTAQDKKVILSFGSPDNFEKIEKFNNNRFQFEGYNIYQLDPTEPENMEKSIKIKTVDFKNNITRIFSRPERDLSDLTTPERLLLQKGEDSGIEHYLAIDEDYQKNSQLINHVEYIYGVSWYYYGEINGESFLRESEPEIVRVRPVSFIPGIEQQSYFKTLSAEKTSVNNSEAFVKPIIIHPELITGDLYEISVKSADMNGKPVNWELRNLTKSTVEFTSDIFRESKENIVHDGILWQLINEDDSGKLLGLTANDKWVVDTKTEIRSFSAQKAKSDLDRINIYPNPYFGGNQYETHRFLKKVTFTNLPNNVTIRIFTIAGSNVGTLRKNDERTTMDWNLLNESNFLVASGMYIAYIETPFGTKILKFAVIQDIPYLDTI